jgi:cytochrome oxidase Cu insertion factor (SCO1/SenC/PrrC family)
VATRPGRTLSGAAAGQHAPRRQLFGGARRRFGLAIAIAALAGALVGDAWHLSQPSAPAPLTLPSFHGQGHWGPRERPAPNFTLRDQNGASVSLAAQRGAPLVIAFFKLTGPGSSRAEVVSLAQAQVIVPRSRRPVLDLISLDRRPDTAAEIRAALHGWGLRPPYHWLSGSPATIARIAAEYGVRAGAPPGAGAATPLYLVDRSGFERAGYLYPFFPTVLAGDLETLSRRA